jgi:hypothetical protein
MQAGIESCNEPAIALLFGEAVRLKDISILGRMKGAFDSVQSMHKDMNRYAALGLDEDLGDSRPLLPLSTVSHNPYLGRVRFSSLNCKGVARLLFTTYAYFSV